MTGWPTASAATRYSRTSTSGSPSPTSTAGAAWTTARAGAARSEPGCWPGVGVAVALVVVAGVVLANLRTTPKGGRIEVNSAPDISPDRIRLGGLKAVSDPNPSAVREHKDFRKSNQGRTMAPGETIDAQEQVPLDSAGTWKLWPC